MVRQTALRIVIGADTLGTVSRAHLAVAFRRNFRIVLGFCASRRLRSTLSALSLFLYWLRSSWTFHDHPVGRCVTRIADEFY